MLSPHTALTMTASLSAQTGAIEEDFVLPKVPEDSEEKFYPKEIVGHSLPHNHQMRSHTAPTEYIVQVKWLDYPHDQNTEEPLLTFGKLKKAKGYD
jgi:hypothetical protein